MTSTNTTPPAPAPANTASAPEANPPKSGPAPASSQTSTTPTHWSRGAISGAGRLISTAANDEMVRSMISSRARGNLAAGLFGGTLVGAIAARIATRSVPGALLVGGALIAKAIYDQRKASETPPKP
ncbi:hypothetical protein [Blastomonas aquatica]|uniref:Uncharacterized protein n=1 Tax=Blastomonas aquatica TaxID=1510276 RepID=A0ABQ1JJ70_9SPHN|nr:hypothetical protein [Blastomonas aquatica]GGB68522.1 hypothetical protein GCM10010833_24680 [Blastomonas aquatica]